jgi:acyl carrier protein
VAMADQTTIRGTLKRLIVESLNLEGLTPESIGDDTPLFGQGLGLDSVDALELVVALEQEYGISIESHDVDKTVFTSVASLGEFVSRTLAGPNHRPSPDGQ